MTMSAPMQIDTSQMQHRNHGDESVPPTQNGTPSSSSMNITSPAFESTLVSFASRMLKMKSPQTAVIDESVAPYVTSILRSTLSNLSDDDLSRLSTGGGALGEKGDQSGGLDIQAVVGEYDALMELLMEQCEMEADNARETLELIAKAIQTGDCEVSLLDHFGGNSHSSSRKNSFNALVGNGTLMMGYGDIGNKYRSKSMGAEHEFYAEEDAVRLLGDMLQEKRGFSSVRRKDSVGSVSTLPAWSVVNHNDSESPSRGAGGVIEEEPSFFFEEDQAPTPEKYEENKNQAFMPISSQMQTPLKQDSANFLITGLSPFMTEEEKKVAEGLKNLPAPTFSFTPLKQDQLIPLDLLGAIDDPSSPMGFLSLVQQDAISMRNSDTLYATPEKNSPHTTEAEGSKGSGNGDQQDVVDGNVSESVSSPLPADPNATPVPETTATVPHGKPFVSGKGKKKGKKNNDLAAALFTRPRSRSMHSYDDKSPKLKPMAPPPASQIGMAGLKNCSADALMRNSIPALFQKQLDSAVEILLAMNYDVYRDAAHEAALVSNADVNIAQHVIDGALAAPPVCRHLLNDGCYRSDCHFSHDVDGHTCLFWLRGRCGKGDGCRFMHGFSEKLLDGVNVEEVTKNSFLLPPAQATPKSVGVKTGNLVQHNMKASFSKSFESSSMGFASAASRVSFSASSGGSVLRNRSVSDAGTFHPSRDLQVNPPLSKTPPPMSMTNNPSTDLKPQEAVSECSTPPTFSFASIASKGYSKASSFNKDKPGTTSTGKTSNEIKKTVRVPQNLWTSTHQRSSGAFRITDPIARYKEVANSVQRNDVIDLHFQSIKTFPIVLSTILPEKLKDHGEVWIVTGSGHHVNKISHLKAGGVLENAVTGWLVSNDYNFAKGKDKNGFGGALLVYGR